MNEQMRPIKFRVWTGSGMEYNILAGALGAFYAPGLDQKDTACISPFNTIYTKDTPVMQFTGLKDRNGLEIYEGDIVKVVWEEAYDDDQENRVPENSTVHKVLWCDDYPTFDLEPPLECESNGLQYAMIDHSLAVIGNIHQNPDLLTQPTSPEKR